MTKINFFEQRHEQTFDEIDGLRREIATVDGQVRIVIVL